MNKLFFSLLFFLSSGSLFGMLETKRASATHEQLLAHHRRLEAALSSVPRDLVLAAELLVDPLTNLEYRSRDFGPVWLYIREWYHDQPLIETLRRHEQTLNEPAGSQLCKAAADLDLPCVIKLISNITITPNERANALMLLLKFANYKLSWAREKSEKLAKAIQENEALGENEKRRQNAKITLEYEDNCAHILKDSEAILRLFLSSSEFNLGLCVTPREGTAFHLATATPHLLKILLFFCGEKVGEFLSKLDAGRRTPLHCAAETNLESLDMLCKAKPLIHQDNGHSALFRAASAYNKDELWRRNALYCLVENGACLDVRDSNQKRPFDTLIERWDHVVNIPLLYTFLALGDKEKSGRDLVLPQVAQTEPPLDGRNLQHDFEDYCRRFAIFEDRYKAFFGEGTFPEEALKSIDPNAADGFGLTPLMWAAARNNPELTARLLAIPGINPSVTDSRGNTALHYAVMTRHKSENAHCTGAYDVTALLLAHDGVDISKKNNAGLTARLMANGNYPLLKNTLFKELTKRRLAVLSCANYEECALPYEVLRIIAQYLHLERK